MYNCTLVFTKVVTLQHIMLAISSHPALGTCAELLRHRTLRKVSQWADAHASGQEMNKQHTVWTRGTPSIHADACFSSDDPFARATGLKGCLCLGGVLEVYCSQTCQLPCMGALESALLFCLACCSMLGPLSWAGACSFKCQDPAQYKCLAGAQLRQ